MHLADKSDASDVGLRDYYADDIGNANLPDASTTIGGHTVSLSGGRMVAIPEGIWSDVYVHALT